MSAILPYTLARQRKHDRGDYYKRKYTNEHKKTHRNEAAKAALCSEVAKTRKSLNKVQKSLTRALEREAKLNKAKNVLRMQRDRERATGQTPFHSMELKMKSNIRKVKL